MEAMSAEVPKPKLKILCLHGYNQNASLFRKKLGAFRKGIKFIADLVFIDAPHIIPRADTDKCNEVDEANEMDDSSNDAGPGLSWWYSAPEESFHPMEPSELDSGFAESLEHVKKAFATHGPFDGILGFSQGASFVSLLCGLQEKDEFEHDFKFVILISGFKSPSECHKVLYQKPFHVPSLHVIGEADNIIQKDVSKELAEMFGTREILYHDGGHYMPSTKDFRTAYKLFLRNVQ